MKKMLILPMIMLMMVMVATTAFAATSTVADKLYSKGASYGVTADHKKQMDEYFTNNPTTAEEEAYILAKADECIAIMDKAGVKDVTKLSESDLNAVKAKVQDAAKKIGLTVTYQGTSFKVSKNGKAVGEYVVKSASTGTTTTSTKKFVYTGSNSTYAFVSVAIAVVALGAVVKLRKNA